MHRSNVFWLASLTTLLIFIALEPLLSYVVFGSDTGEYYALTSTLITTGHLAPGMPYGGWGFAYPDFPGMFILAGSVAQGVGTDALSALIYTIPVVAVLSVLPLFLVFRRLFANDTIAILGAGLATLALPRMFSLAHPAPLALGDFFVVAGMWMFVEGRRDVRWYVPLALTLGALIVTHHLSSFFFALSAIGMVVLFELLRPGGWTRRFPLRELLLVAGFTIAMWTYWLGYAVAFRAIIIVPLQEYGTWALDHLALFTALGALGIAAVAALLGLLLAWRRRGRDLRPARVTFPSDRSFLIEIVGFAVAIFAGVALLTVFVVPGTNQTASVGTILWVTPLLIALVFTAGTHRMLTSSRVGLAAIFWIGALLVGLVTSTVLVFASPAIASAQPLSPSRFAEYFLIPVMFLVAIGLGRLVARAGDVGGRRALVACGAAVVLLVAANAAIVYPPPSVFGGFQEGYLPQEEAVWQWMGLGIPASAVVASDHRMSSMIFGINGNPATWDSTPVLFTGSNQSEAFEELNGSLAPHTERPVNVVVVTSTMYSGVALDPSQLAQPLSPEAQYWFTQPPFVPLYENGLNTVYWVAWPPP